MYRVINGAHGTARQASLGDPDRAMAGKTGTSQVQRISRSERASGVRKNEEKPWEERDHALFVAFAPYREPRYAISVVVEHGGSGSLAAAPIARDIMIKALEIDPIRRAPGADRRTRAARARGRRSGLGPMASAVRFKSVELTLVEKLRLLNWPFICVVATIALIGYGTLYSAGGGSHSPWAWRHSVRFGVGVAAMLVIALIDIRFWFRWAYAIYAAALLRPDRGRDRRRHQHGRATLDQPRSVPAAALGGDEDRARARPRPLLPRRLPRGRGAPRAADRAARDGPRTGRAGTETAGPRHVGHAACRRRGDDVPGRRPLVEVRRRDRWQPSRPCRSSGSSCTAIRNSAS